ncbi:MAG: hypothetical protein RLZZ453_649 [Chlamydiota bacterium]|jgi:hypothetical protein
MKYLLFCNLLWSALCALTLDECIETAERRNQPIVCLCLAQPDSPWAAFLQKHLIDDPLFAYELKKTALLYVVKGENPFDVNSEIVLLDPRGVPFATLEYDGSQAVLFAQRVMQTIENFHAICLALEQGLSQKSEEELKELYFKAASLSDPSFCGALLKVGMEREKGTFFQLEKYARLLKQHKLKDPIVRKLRRKILAKDPGNKQYAHRDIAWLDFRKRSEELPSPASVKKVIAPLVSYLKHFSDSERWKIEMRIAEFLFSKEVQDLSYSYAIQAYQDAPQEAKEDVKKIIAYMGWTL